MRSQTSWGSKFPVRPGRRLFSERRMGSLPTDIHLTPSQHLGVLPQSEYMERTGSRVVLNLKGADNMKHVAPNDFVIHLRSFQGGIEISHYTGKVSNAYTVLTPGPLVEPRYFRWVLKSEAFIQELQSTTNQLRDGQSIKYGDFGQILLPLPPLEEQRRIADFLDEQTSRIDHAIQLRQRELELLGQQAAQRIEAVLWRDATGIRVRYLAASVTSGPRGWGDLIRDQGTQFIRVVNLPRAGVTLEGAHMAYVDLPNTQEAHRSTCEAGDILVAITGATVGHCAVVTDDASGGTFSQHVARIRPLPGTCSEWLAWCLQAPRIRDLLRERSTSGVKQGLGLEDVKDLKVPSYDQATQFRLAEVVGREWAGLEARSGLITRSLGLLEERKGSLINAAVTGEFDVSSASRRADDAVVSG